MPDRNQYTHQKASTPRHFAFVLHNDAIQGVAEAQSFREAKTQHQNEHDRVALVCSVVSGILIAVPAKGVGVRIGFEAERVGEHQK